MPTRPGAGPTRDAPSSLPALDAHAAGATFLLGHHPIAFDAPHLAAGARRKVVRYAPVSAAAAARSTPAPRPAPAPWRR